MTRPPRRPSPTVKARRVAGTLRELRVKSGFTVTEAARAVDRDQSWLSRIEGLESRAHPNDVRALLTLYELDAASTEAVVALARQARKRGWWVKYGPVMPKGFGLFVGLEADASMIRAFEAQVVPGLLQTANYARAAIMCAATPDSAEHVERQIALRLERQAVLDAEDPPHLRVVLDEAVLRRPFGGRKTMAEQVLHLATMATRPNIQIQVLPFEAGAHAGVDGSFEIMDFPPPPEDYPLAADDRIVSIDSLLNAFYLEEPREVATYAQTWEQIRAEALSPDESVEMLRRIATELSV